MRHVLGPSPRLPLPRAPFDLSKAAAGPSLAGRSPFRARRCARAERRFHLTADAAAAEDIAMSQSCRPLVVDADGHVCEPPDLWERNLPASMRARGPRVRWSDPDACEQVLVEDAIAI